MKQSVTKSVVKALPPVFPKTSHQFRPVTNAAERLKATERNNIFSKSRDTLEDRGMREMKASRNAQTFPHGK